MGTAAFNASRVQLSYGEETTPGTKATTSAAQFGIVGTVDSPDETITWNKYWNIGGGRDYQTKAEGPHILEGGFTSILQKGDPLLYAFGDESTVGTADGTGGSTLNGALAAGATSIVLADATGYSNGEFIQIDVTGNAEVREIASIAGAPTITVTKPIRRAHSSGVACAEVIAPYTHTLKLGSTPIPFTLEMAQLASANLVMHYTGCYHNTLELGCEEEAELQATYGIIGMKTEASGTTATSVSTATTVPYMYDEGVITALGGTLGRVKSYKVNMNNKLKALRYIQSTNPLYPFEIVYGRRENQITMSVVANETDDDSWVDLLKTPGSATTFSAKHTRSANDYIDIQATDCHLAEAPHNFAEENEQTVDMVLEAKTIVAEVKDSTPYYLAV